MAQITESGQGGPAGLAAGTGLQMTAAMSEEDVARLCGPDGEHSPGRRPGPLPPGPAGPGTGNDHWYSASCPTLHDIAPEMLVRPYTLREAPRGHDPGTMRPRQR